MMLDYDNNGFITIHNIKKMIAGISVLWNYLTGAQVTPSEEYIQKVFNNMDVKGTG